MLAARSHSQSSLHFPSSLRLFSSIIYGLSARPVTKLQNPEHENHVLSLLHYAAGADANT